MLVVLLCVSEVSAVKDIHPVYAPKSSRADNMVVIGLFCVSGCIDDVLGGCGFINGQQVSVNDDNSHGTHVAGTIGATKNGAGVLGVAQKVSLMSCKFLDANGDGFNSDAIACINYCAANFKRMGQKVPIYSNSWGCLNCYDPTVYNAIANTAGQLHLIDTHIHAFTCPAFPCHPPWPWLCFDICSIQATFSCFFFVAPQEGQEAVVASSP